MNCATEVWKNDEIVKEKGWELDLSKIGTSSKAKDAIVLPYSGDLGFGKDYTAELLIQILRPYEDVNMTLRIMEASEKKPFASFDMEADREEIKRILEPVLAANGSQGEESGLDPYWYGFYQANYLTWKHFSNPYFLCGFVLNPENRKTLENKGYKIVSCLDKAG